ncbi:MAG TPA: T9SS type A sorting domain-containing protein, partial [Candidatus Obscuribacterales bacterium]
TITEGLGSLTNLNVSDNELTGVGTLTSLGSLSTLNMSGNRLDFVQIAGQLNRGYTVNYENQKPVLQQVRTLQQIGSSYTIDRTVGGGESYSWTQNGSAISQSGSSFTLTISDFSAEGSYVATVTSSQVPGLTLTTRPVVLRVSSLQRDSTALINIRSALITTNSTISNWPTLPVSSWEEVTIENQRVTGLDLSGLNLANEMPEDILDIGNLRRVDLSDNEISYLPDLTPLSASLTLVDASDNALTFESLEPNVTLSDFRYDNQAPIGEELEDSVGVPRGETAFLTIQTPGNGLRYQWYKDGSELPTATTANLTIEDAAIEDIAKYYVEVTSEQVPDLTLRSKDQELSVYADIEYFPAFTYADGVRGLLEEGEGILLKIREQGPYDTVAVVQVANNAVLFENQLLGDYLLKVDTEDDFRQYKEYSYSADSIGIDTVEFIPTHYISALEWDSAQVLQLRDYISDTLEMLRIPPPLLPIAGNDGIIEMTVESDLLDDNGLRLEARRRVRKAGCSLRKNQRVGGGRTENEEEWELIAYKETDDDGNVDFGFLPNGLYRINIQYPGVPMDPNSFIEFEISEDEEEDGYVLAATIFEDGIQVGVVEELGYLIEYFKELNVYPNPADTQIEIDYLKLNSKDVSYELLDMSGHVIRAGKLEKGHRQSTTLSTAEVRDGLYLLRFFDRTANGKHLITYKVIIRH